MGRKKRNGMKMPPRSFKKFPSKEKVKRMASREDLTRVEQDIHAIRMEAKTAVDKFNDYAKAVAGQIKEILDEVGVYEEVSGIEKSRDEVRKTLEEKLKGLQAKVNDLLKIRAYMAQSAASAPVEAPVAETAPVAVEEAPVAEASVEEKVEEAPAAEEPSAPEKKKGKKEKEKAASAPAPVEPAPVEAAPAPAKKERKPVEPPKF